MFVRLRTRHGAHHHLSAKQIAITMPKRLALQKLEAIMERFQTHDDATVNSLCTLKYNQGVLDAKAKRQVSNLESLNYLLRIFGLPFERLICIWID